MQFNSTNPTKSTHWIRFPTRNTLVPIFSLHIQNSYTFLQRETENAACFNEAFIYSRAQRRLKEIKHVNSKPFNQIAFTVLLDVYVAVCDICRWCSKRFASMSNMCQSRFNNCQRRGFSKELLLIKHRSSLCVLNFIGFFLRYRYCMLLW